MNTSASFVRKISYIAAIALLLLPIAALSQPATVAPGPQGGTSAGASAGGKLAQLRVRYNLAQAELGEIDPASETMKLSTLGLRGVAANILWGWANHYKKIEDWDKLESTVNQIIRLQPNFVEVWDFQAHNLSYNVSVEFDDYRMRYQWVKKGIDFLILGTHYNRDEPGLLSQLGWFTGQKVGRADEQKQFRRLFREDKDFHTEFRDNGVEVEEALGPDRKPDNWLVARLWFNKAIDAVTSSSKPIRGNTPLLFYRGGAMSQINGAAAMQKDGYFFQVAQLAWQRAIDSWKRYGDLELPTSAGFNIHLNDQEAVDKRIVDAQAEMDRICAGAAEAIRQERRAALSAEKKTALDTPAEQRTTEQQMLAYEAEREMDVQPRDYLAKAPREERPRVRQLIDQMEQDRATSHQIALNRRIVNFEYWRLRCESELTDEAPQAHSSMYEADKLFRGGDNLTKARDLYVQAWKLYNTLFTKYPDLMDNAEAQDLVDAVGRYRDLLGQLDEPFPTDFPLWPLLEKHEKGKQIRDQVKLLQGEAGDKPQEPSSEKPSTEKPADQPADNRPADNRSSDKPTERPAEAAEKPKAAAEPGKEATAEKVKAPEADSPQEPAAEKAKESGEPKAKSDPDA